jgi:transcriptional regulator with GAF, ATPase, and Fis domain
MSTRPHKRAALDIWALTAVLVALNAVLWVQSGVNLNVSVASLMVIQFALIIALAVLATRGIGLLHKSLDQTEHAARSTRGEFEQLQMHNAMLQVLARSVDVPLAFQELAGRISRLVPCDRVGLALLTEDDEFQTYTAVVGERERRTRPRPEVVFKAGRTAIGQAVRAREPVIINDTEAAAPDYLDVNVLHTSGFGSGLVIPLITDERAVGTLNVVARPKGAFRHEHVEKLLPVTEMFAVAHVAQQLLSTATRQRTMQSVAELTAGVSAEINNALQAIVGQCNVLQHEYADRDLQRDITTVVRQAQRIAGLMEKIRTASMAGQQGQPTP